MMIASNNSSICGRPLNVQFCCYVTTREKIRQNAFLLIYIFIPVCWSLVSRGNKTNRTGTDYCDLSGLDIVSLCACLSLIKQFWELFLSSLCLNSSSSFVLTVGLKYLHRHTVSHHQDQEKKQCMAVHQQCTSLQLQTLCSWHTFYTHIQDSSILKQS